MIRWQLHEGSPKIQTPLDNFLDCPYSCNKENLNLAVNNINNIFRQTAKEAQLKLTKNKPKMIPNKKWFDTDCKMIRKNLRRIRRTLSNKKNTETPTMLIYAFFTVRPYSSTKHYTQAQKTTI